MAVCNLSDLNEQLKKGQCLLGLDPGRTVLGVALSDPERRVASPLLSLQRKKIADDAETLLKIIAERKVGGIIVGLPLNMDGSEGPAVQSARGFIRNLFKHPGMPDLPTVFWDERFSTAAVERFLLQEDMSRKRRDDVIDKMAAAYLLQGALDRLMSLSHPIK